MKIFQRQALLAAVALILLPIHGVMAADKVPAPESNAVLANFISNGSKIYYLGKQSGLDGWLIVKDNQMQISYTNDDKDHALIGAMFGGRGENVTAAQIQTLLST